MATHATLSALFSAIADAIRAKTGSTDPIVADDFPAAIAAIGPSVTMGSFTIEENLDLGDLGPIGTYQFEVGMTWGDFIQSSYNTDSFSLTSDGRIYCTTVDPSIVLSTYYGTSAYPTPYENALISDAGKYQWNPR